MRHNEIIELHTSVAIWMRKHKWIYDYEVWLNESNRIDFVAFDMRRGINILGEVGNNYQNEEELIDKLLQCKRYADILPSYEIVLFLPVDYHQHDELLDYLCGFFKIRVIRVEIHDFVDNYNKFFKIIFKNYKNYTPLIYPNKGVFKKFTKLQEA